MGDVGAAPDRARLHRFFVDPSALTAGRVAFTMAQQQQVRRVLRLSDGDRVVVCPDDGTERVTVLRVSGTTVWGEPGDPYPGLGEPTRDVWLYPSALRGDRFTWLLQKGTEIGVHGFAPVLFRYTQPADYRTRLERYGAVVREAAEQCRRARLPALLPAQPFAEALVASGTSPGALRLLLDERETEPSLRSALAADHATVCLFVGPEGGLSDDERALAHTYGVQSVSLGRRVLRSETAGLIGAALTLAASGDLG